MHSRIEAKLANLLEYLIQKPVEKLTLDDYTVLTSELQRLGYAEDIKGFFSIFNV